VVPDWFDLAISDGHAATLADVGLHLNPGITLFDLICCTKIPEFEAVDVL
jgi:hypothetical protein